ncbi:hypothetical protein FB451DRAFT_1220888 [Mycena latifolia]|nr:hypothetical protein FB451DRAFT_1220888 [Mycena latifolia]
MDAEIQLRNIAAVFDNAPDPYGQLRRRREDLEKLVSRGALRVSQRLPSELLSEIFLFLLPVTLPAKLDEPLLVLPQVCRAWKDLVSQSPELWASISITFDREGVDVQGIARIADHWLSHSGTTYPLSITAACTGPYATIVHDNPDLVSPFMDTVLSHTHRLKHVDLSFPIAAILALPRLPSGSLSCLETLCLRPVLSLSDMATPETGHADWHWPADSKALESSLSIREISYVPYLLFTIEELEALVPNVLEEAMRDDGGVVTQNAMFAPTVWLPWSQLSAIRLPLSGFTPATWFSILTECPRLEELWLSMKPSRHSHSTSLIHLDHLKLLVVNGYLGGTEEILDILVTPKLNGICLAGIRIAPSAFLDFQIRSHFKLECMVFSSPIAADDLELFFGPLANLKGLGFFLISTDHFPASFWDRIRRSELFPKLAWFAVRPTATQISYLVDIIESRWGHLEFSASFHNIRPAHLAAVEEELKRLDKYGSDEVKRRVEIETV